MNHEARINQLEKRILELEKVIYGSGLFDQWIPVSKSKSVIGQSPWVVKDKIKADILLNEKYLNETPHEVEFQK